MSAPLKSATVAFCRAYVLEPNGKQAYLKAYPGVTGRTAEANASRLLRNAKVKAEIARLRQPVDTVSMLTLGRKRALLYQVAEDAGEDTGQRLRAIELDAKLAGELTGELIATKQPYAVPSEIIEVVRLQAVALFGREADVREARAAIEANRAPASSG